jgi:hypothetical protein
MAFTWPGHKTSYFPLVVTFPHHIPPLRIHMHFPVRVIVRWWKTSKYKSSWMNKFSYLPHYHAINRGYSMLFDEYEIHFMSETGFLIFSRVWSTRENIIKILSDEWNKFHIHQQSIEFSVYYTFSLLFEHVCFKYMKGFRAVTQHNVVIKNTDVTISFVTLTLSLFSLWK